MSDHLSCDPLKPTRRQWCGAIAAGIGAWSIQETQADESFCPGSPRDPGCPADEPQIAAANRADGRFISTLAALHAQIKNNPPKLAFDATMNARALTDWRRQVVDQLRSILRVPAEFAQVPARHIWTKQRNGYAMHQWEVYPEPYAVAPFIVLVPDGVSAASPAPTVMCFPGSPDTKEVLVGEPELIDLKPHRLWEKNQMALHYVRAGYVAVAVDNPGVGELAGGKPVNWNAIALNALWAGRCFEGISVLHKMAVLSWLKQQSFVKKDRIAVSGHSLGAKPALSMMVLDDSIAALIYNDALVDWRRRAIATDLYGLSPVQYVPGLFEWFDYFDLFTAAAPRPVLVPEGARVPEMNLLKTAWQKYDAEHALTILQQPKFRDPANRQFDDQRELPEGLTMQAWMDVANVEPANHFFHDDIAIPWMKKQLMN